MTEAGAEKIALIVVDDSEDDLNIFEMAFKKSGLTCSFKMLLSANELISYFDEIENNKKVLPDTVLLDINMPGTSGLEALEQIRSRPAFKEEPKIIMLSTSDNPKEIARSKELGANGYKVKPLRFAEFIDFLKDLAI